MNGKEILIVIDMQKDFLDGALPNADAAAIVDGIVQEITEWKGDVFYTKDTHGPDFKQTLEGFLPEHCIRFSEGWQFEPKIQKALDAANATCIEKPTFGYLGWAHTLIDVSSEDQSALAALGKAKIKRIRIVGTCTDICVISNALILRAMFKDTPIEVVASKCAATSKGNQDAALAVMGVCGITVC